jgi:hypothetical protein
MPSAARTAGSDKKPAAAKEIETARRTFVPPKDLQEAEEHCRRPTRMNFARSTPQKRRKKTGGRIMVLR